MYPSASCRTEAVSDWQHRISVTVHANAVHINPSVKGQKEGDRVNPLP